MIMKIERKKLLIVEGRDEQLCFEAALRDHLCLTEIQVMPIGGKTRLPGSLAALKADPDFVTVVSLAVVRDADETTAGAATPSAIRSFQSVCGSLRHVGLACPAAHGQFADGRPRVGVFIVPNGTDDGMLETLCLDSVSTLPEFTCVDAYFQCLQGLQVVPGNHHKARAHAWLASRKEPDKRVGEAALAGYWPWDSTSFNELWAFIRSL
jgi:Protein of unknown function (DUF3226)